MKKDLLKLLDLTSKDIINILDLADQLKYEQKKGVTHKRNLKGKTLGMIFQKSSTRTRVSFEVGILQLGGHALFLSPRDIQLGRGESIEDTARVLSRYVDGIMIRTYDQQEVETLAEYASIPIINGLTDFAHPCQVLADLMTIREYKNKLAGLKMCFIGDGANNMSNSLIVGALKTGMDISIACPKGVEPAPEIMEFAKTVKGATLTVTDDVLEACKDADVLYTDVWASMGQEEEAAERQKLFAGYQINDKTLSVAKEDCLVFHCLPAHKGEEITAEAFDAHADEIFDEAENRLHVQKAIMVLLMEKR
ncbi:MAG: ornithine carbamoyltransferase [Ruminococcaceae bacterium]|nr:ornithine carbamoyltransferase [Oscillospiraceae bacterium]